MTFLWDKHVHSSFFFLALVVPRFFLAFLRLCYNYTPVTHPLTLLMVLQLPYDVAHALTSLLGKLRSTLLDAVINVTLLEKVDW